MALVVFNAKSPHVEDLKRAPERTFRIKDTFVRMRQQWKPGGDGGTLLKHGGSVYDAAFILGDYLAREPVPLYGKRVVELGCGPGLGSVAAALLGASEVIATDGDPNLLPLVAENFDINIPTTSRSRCKCAQVLWGDSAAVSALAPPFDVVLAADCAAVVYENSFLDLVNCLVALSSENSLVLLSYHRRHKAEDAFFTMLHKFFAITRIPSSKIHPDFIEANILIFQLRKLAMPAASSSEPPSSIDSAIQQAAESPRTGV